MFLWASCCPRPAPCLSWWSECLHGAGRAVKQQPLFFPFLWICSIRFTKWAVRSWAPVAPALTGTRPRLPWWQRVCAPFSGHSGHVLLEESLHPGGERAGAAALGPLMLCSRTWWECTEPWGNQLLWGKLQTKNVLIPQISDCSRGAVMSVPPSREHFYAASSLGKVWASWLLFSYQKSCS